MKVEVARRSLHAVSDDRPVGLAAPGRDDTLPQGELLRSIGAAG